jgi:inner membrane protein
MDNLTHSLVGAALAQTPLGKLHAHSTALLVVAANLPDVDYFTAFAGKQAHFIHHRGLTHSLAGLVVEALAMAGGVRAWESRRAKRGGAAASPWRNLLLVCFVGLCSHTVLDYFNTYGVRPWLPFDATWYYGDVMFIVDPWWWLALGAALATAGPRTRRGHAWLGLAGVLATGAIYWTSLPPIYFRVLWPFAVGAIVLLRLSKLGSKRPAAPVAILGVVTALYLALLDHNGDRAVREVELARKDGETTLEVVRSPRLLDPRAWIVFVETDRAVYRTEVELGEESQPTVRLDKHADDPNVALALASPCTAGWRIFARLPIAAVESFEIGTLVRVGDARYQVTAESAAWSSTEVLIQPDSTVLCLEEGPAPPPVPRPGARK